MPLEADFIGHIEDTGNAEGRIDQEAHQTLNAAVHFPLQGVVDGITGIAEIIDNIRNAGAYPLRRPFNISFCHRPKKGPVD